MKGAWFFFLAVFLLKQSPAWGAACCSSQSAAPAVITGDERARVNVTSSVARVVADAPPQGLAVFRDHQDEENSLLQTFSGATLISDRFQLGTSLSLLHRMRHRSDPSQTGVSQLILGGAYEAVTDWTYHPLRPKVVLFTSYAIPFGSSIYDAGANGSATTPAFGTGFQRLNVGAIALKQWNPWDTSLTVETHHSISRSFAAGAPGLGDAEVSPGRGASVLANGGRLIGSTGAHRLGIRLGYEWDEGREVRNSSSLTRGQYQSRVSVGLDYAFTLENEMLVALHYTDQTLLGPARNVSLSRILGVEWSVPFQR